MFASAIPCTLPRNYRILCEWLATVSATYSIAAQVQARAFHDLAAKADEQITVLLAATDGHVLTSLPGVATIRAAAFAAHSLPIDAVPRRRTPLLGDRAWHRRSTSRPPCTGGGRISRQGLAEHRDASDGHRLGTVAAVAVLRSSATPNCAPAAWPRSRPASRWPATPADWPTDSFEPNNPSMNSAIVEEGSVAER